MSTLTTVRTAWRGVSGLVGWLGFIVAIIALVFVLQGRGATQPQAEASKLFEVLERGKLILGVTSEVAPFGYVDESGQLVGFDIDVGKLIAKSLFEDETKIEFKRISFPSRWPAVNTGEVDAGIMVTTIWPDRLARVNFTTGYIRSGIAVLTRDDIGITILEELNKADYTMAILDTPSEFKLMEDFLPNMEYLVFGSEADMLTAVRTKRAEALLIDQPVAKWRAEELPNLQTLGIIGPQTQNAIFLRQNDFQWWWYLNSLVVEMRCGSLYEDYTAVYQKWFGVKPPPRESCLSFSEEDYFKMIGSGLE